MKFTARFASSLFLTLVLAGGALAQQIDIPYRKEVLTNGLTVIVHEDHKAPVVAVNVWYHVGSKNEVKGRTGFAHLFEHLMFQGSEDYNDEYIEFLEKLGATDWNGTTWLDRTNYYETVPKNALDTALWLESDRMGHFAGTITQAKLDEQRGVVENEKRQGDNQPYGRVWEMLHPTLFPPDHPYSWETIGSMEDLNAATVDDVKSWFKAYYGPNNAVLAVAGDVDTEQVLKKVQLYFGDIAAVPPITRPGVWVPRHTESRRLAMQDRVSQARIYKVWTGPQWGSTDSFRLDLAAAILGGDKNSRLYQRLVRRDRLATSVEFSLEAFEIAGIADLEVSVAPGTDPAKAEAAVNDELQRFMKTGPTPSELDRVRAQQRAGFLQGVERVGGSGGKAGILAESMVYGGTPDYYKQELAAADSAKPEDLRRVIADWLSAGDRTLTVTPYAGLQKSTAGADRSSGPPSAGAAPTVGFPAFERVKLANGMQIILAPRPGIGFVEMQLVLDGGSAADPASSPGTATLSMSMLDEGTPTRSSVQIGEQLAQLGANLATGAKLDTLAVSLSALKGKLAPAMEIFADVILHPTFPATELERLRGIHLAALKQEKTRPTSMALRVLPKLLYGAGHAYAHPLTGTGTEASLKAAVPAGLAAFHSAWFKPNAATLIVAGDTTMADLKPVVERLFGAWKPGAVPAKNIGAAKPADTGVLYLVDRPDSDQSVIFAGQIVPPKANADEFALQAANGILGGLASARLNMNLREDKHWSYGSFSLIFDTRGERPLLVYAPVQTDKTREALQEMRAEMRAITATRLPQETELARVKQTHILSLPGRWETAGAVAGGLGELVRFGLPDDYWAHYAERTNAVTIADVDRVARSLIKPDQQIWVVVGDRARIEPGLRQLGFADIRLIDADGESP
jgi:zinc protease